MAYDTRKTGTGFTNLSNIYAANQGNQLGQAVSSNIQQAGQQAQQGIQQAQQQFQTEAEKNRTDTAANKQFAQQTIGGIVQGDQTVQATDEQKNKFKDILAGQYKGPQDLGDKYQSLYQQSQQAQNLGNLATSSGGRQELLRQTVGGTGYGAGMRKIDSALLGQQGQQLAQARRATQGLVQDTEQAQRQAQLTGQQLGSQAQQFAQDVKGQIGSNLGTMDTTVQGQVAAAQKVEADRQAKIQALQQFAAGQVQKVDANGKPMVDYNGNPIMVSSRPIGNLGAGANQGVQNAAQAQYFANMLGSMGLTNADQTKALTGGVTSLASEEQQRQNSAYNNARINSLLEAFNAGYGGASALKPKIDFSNAQAFNTTATNQVGSYNANSNYGGGLSLNQAYTQQVNNPFIAKTGILGKALISGNQNDIYNKIATQANNSQGAQNLSAQGVADAATRAKYTALQQLLGLGGTDIKYDPNAPQYQAGKLNIDTSKL